MNPVQQMMAMAKSGQNPQQLIMNFLQSPSSPMGQNLFKLAQSHDMKGLEQIARNLCAQKGLDYDSEFAAFKKTLGL